MEHSDYRMDWQDINELSVLVMQKVSNATKMLSKEPLKAVKRYPKTSLNI